MRDDDRQLSAEAQKIMRYATIADLKADCDELSKLYAALDDHERARLFVLLFGPDSRAALGINPCPKSCTQRRPGPSENHCCRVQRPE